MNNYLLTIDHDSDTERPDNGIGHIVSFNSRHVNFEHPDDWLAVEDECEPCGGDGWKGGRDPTDYEECETCEGDGYTTSTHPDVLAVMSYYEHGSCRWMVGESVVPDHGGFDTVGVAGVIVWNGGDNDRAWWWNDLTNMKRREILDAIAVEYTMWCNGETYAYSLEGLSMCGECGHIASDTIIEIDSCGGIIGTERLIEMIREEMSGIDADDIEIGGECGYVIQASDLVSDVVVKG